MEQIATQNQFKDFKNMDAEYITDAGHGVMMNKTQRIMQFNLKVNGAILVSLTRLKKERKAEFGISKSKGMKRLKYQKIYIATKIVTVKNIKTACHAVTITAI